MPDRHPTPPHRRHFARAAALALAAAAAVFACPVAAAAAELPMQTSFAANPTEPSAASNHTWTVPAGVTEVTFYAAGGAGGAGGNGGGVGGGGGSAEANLAVTPGQTFTITVGGSGADGAAPQLGGVAAGGTGGGPSGGRGGDGGPAQLSTTGVLGGGGGAGGASSVSLPAGGAASLVLVAPGGGGGGAGSGASTSAGPGTGTAGSPAGAPSTSTASGAAPGSGGSSASGSPGTAGGVGGSGSMAGAGAGGAGGGGAGTATQGGAGGLGTPPGIPGSASGGAAGPAGSGAGGGGDGFFGGGSGGGSTTAAGGGGGGGFYVSPDATDFAELAPTSAAAVSIGYNPPPPPPPTPPAPPQPPAPHPAVVGTPASGQPLTCLATSAIAGETFTYRWVRDLAPVTGATGQTYSAGTVDTGHYLQCVVTGTSVGGSVSGTSGFVAIPLGGTPVAVSRSSIAATARGDAARIVVRCSPRAAGACTISLLLSVVETERGGHVVGVSARLARSAPRRSRTPPTIRRTVIVGSVPVTLGPGQVRVVPVPLDALGRLLLAREHRLPVLVSANGTLIGAISASLGSTLLTLHPAAPTPTTHTVSVASTPAVLAATPYMGWDTYFAFGGAFNEATILDQAHQLIARGLARVGYRYIWFDVGWWHGTRDATGQITIDPTQWPHGLAWLTGILHQAGLLVGLYTDAGSTGCGGPGAGSYGHYQQDVNTFAAWGFDAVKVDFCGGVRQGLDPQSTYTAFHAAILNNASHRPMLLSVCNFLQPGQFATGTPDLLGSGFDSWAFGPSIANSWRTDTDIGRPHDVVFANVLRNLDADAAHPQAAGPGHWNDPDYLGPDQGLSATAYRTQLSIWSMLAAPLMISDDLDTMSTQSASDSANPEVIAIDQDPAGVQGTLVASAGEAEVWVKPLSDGSRAVALLNRGSAPVRIAATALGVGLSRASRYTVRDLWAHRTSTTTGAISAVVPAEGTALYRVAAVPALRGRP